MVWNDLTLGSVLNSIYIHTPVLVRLNDGGRDVAIRGEARGLLEFLSGTAQFSVVREIFFDNDEIVINVYSYEETQKRRNTYLMDKVYNIKRERDEQANSEEED